MGLHKHRGIKRNDKRLHKHPNYPYPHPRGRRHRYSEKSRIKDRKGRKFRQTPQELRRTHVKGTYRPRGDGKRRWD